MRIIVTLENGAKPIIALRLEHTRHVYRATIEGVFTAVVMWELSTRHRDLTRRVKALVKAGSTLRAAKKQARQEERDKE
jgi:hypothetical protein